ncbi:hypothetical protein H696_05160 [Fonticula alba]|uniref:Major vault protein n=1 Tax=Fonticula alba TaxID=691883 RepID=A0A058Z268_FONAL|nr:hypothetical protein H696_05160 [Fonticula alba]KCV68236.1 hypothetical protein H696_05160 [Fonticula alba]|eukprot:XP_009497290.1 hypothetical protein H696_05160 [Fonticula alba]
MPPFEKKSSGSGEIHSVFRIKPYFFLHVLNQNTNVTDVICGPRTFICQDHERVVLEPTPMISIGPAEYCIVENPVAVDPATGAIRRDPATGQILLQLSETEVRLAQPPFPLYPGEKAGELCKLKSIDALSSFRIRATRQFDMEVTVPFGQPKALAAAQAFDPGLTRLLKALPAEELAAAKAAGVPRTFTITRHISDEWMQAGPSTFIPSPNYVMASVVSAHILRKDSAIRLLATANCVSQHDGADRVAGEEWHVPIPGPYVPGVCEQVIGVDTAHILSEGQALLLSAKHTFVDAYGKRRRNAEEWLITYQDAESHLLDVHEQLVKYVNITTLSSRQYCVILDPVCPTTGKNMLGQRKLLRGEQSFFLKPGESLEKGIQSVYVLSSDQGLVLRALEEFTDTSVRPGAAAGAGPVTYMPGDRWMIFGPCEYVPPTSVEVVCQRETIPLSENEGIYVRDNRTGQVRLVHSQSYMLREEEIFFNKELPAEIEALISMDPVSERFSSSNANSLTRQASSRRSKHAAVKFGIPHNAAVQIYDYRARVARVEIGPDLVMLQPDEMFTLLSLSGGRPKRPNAIKSICLLLGPDFCTDIITVETSDHARLQLQLAYNWHFRVPPTPGPGEDRTAFNEEMRKLFSVPDFIGEMCHAIASRIRGTVASVPFDEFHRHSARIIRSSVFGETANATAMAAAAAAASPSTGMEPTMVPTIGGTTATCQEFVLFSNNLVVTSVDIQSVEPVDQRTRDALQKSVQLAIEITTSSQEATAKHEAERLEQEARGRLDRQRILDDAQVEKARQELLQLQSESAAVESQGFAVAEATARAEAAAIEARAAVEQARLRAEAQAIEARSELDRLSAARAAEIDFLQKQLELEVQKSRLLADIEAAKFSNMVGSIGQATLVEMARAGPDAQVRLLQSLGIRSTLITDGKSPINLFQTAQGLVAPPPSAGGLLADVTAGAVPVSGAGQAAPSVAAPASN